jgi:hypothetical protein
MTDFELILKEITEKAEELAKSPAFKVNEFNNRNTPRLKTWDIITNRIEDAPIGNPRAYIGGKYVSQDSRGIAAHLKLFPKRKKRKINE